MGGHHESSILAEGIITWASGVELRVSIVRSSDGPPIVRWPRRKLPDGRQVYVGRMNTRQATEQVERAVLTKWHAEYPRITKREEKRVLGYVFK